MPLRALASGPRWSFADLTGAAVPRAVPGIYAIWHGSLFVYIGMAGRAATADTFVGHRGAPRALAQRLQSHASGKRSGDQFCVYVADRFVLPTLGIEQRADIASGRLSFDDLTRDFIRRELSFSWVALSTGDESRRLERVIQQEGLPPHGPPLLNPARPRAHQRPVR